MDSQRKKFHPFRQEVVDPVEHVDQSGDETAAEVERTETEPLPDGINLDSDTEAEEIPQEKIPQRALRNRRPPNMLHDRMGNPTEFPQYLSSVQTCYAGHHSQVPVFPIRHLPLPLSSSLMPRHQVCYQPSYFYYW